MAEVDPSRRRDAIVDDDDVGRMQQRLFESAVGVGGGANVDPLLAQEPDEGSRDGASGRNDQSLGLARQRKLIPLCRPLVGEHRSGAREHDNGRGRFRLSIRRAIRDGRKVSSPLSGHGERCDARQRAGAMNLASGTVLALANTKHTDIRHPRPELGARAALP